MILPAKNAGNVTGALSTLLVGVQQKLSTMLCKWGNCDVQPCKLTFDEKQKKLYKDLFQPCSNKCSMNTLSNNEQNDSIIQHNITLATQLDQQCKKVKPSSIITLLKNKSSGCTSSVTTMTGASSHGSVVVQSTMMNAGNKD